MTSAQRRLVALAAALAPERAAALLGHLAEGREEARALAATLLDAPRRARLAALAAALPRASEGGAPGGHPLLVRLARERAGAAAARSDGRRTEVRAPAAAPGAHADLACGSALARGVEQGGP